MTGFRATTLGNVMTLQRGYDITKVQQSEGTVPIVSSSGITSFHNAWRVKGPGVVIGRKGTLGSVHFVRTNFWPHDTTLWVKDFKGNHPRFVYYFLQTLALENFDVGASNPTLNRNHLHKIRVVFPEALTIQKRIASVLAAYDDLIENHIHRIALLDKIAEDLFREWFVRLRFPGYKTVGIEKGVPNGWTLVPTIKAFKFIGGGTPSKKNSRYWNGGDLNWFTPSDITAADGPFLEISAEQCTEEGVARSSARMFPARSVMMTSRATIGAIGINTTAACTNQGFITCVPNTRYPLPFLYYWLKLSKAHFELLSGGATFPELTRGTFKKIHILTPPEPLITKFADTVDPMFRTIEALLKENDRLRQIRGKLLPRLVAGRLSVANIQPPSQPASEVKSVSVVYA